jgi:hypothetical protein
LMRPERTGIACVEAVCVNGRVRVATCATRSKQQRRAVENIEACWRREREREREREIRERETHTHTRENEG